MQMSKNNRFCSFAWVGQSSRLLYRGFGFKRRKMSNMTYLQRIHKTPLSWKYVDTSPMDGFECTDIWLEGTGGAEQRCFDPCFLQSTKVEKKALFLQIWLRYSYSIFRSRFKITIWAFLWAFHVDVFVFRKNDNRTPPKFKYCTNTDQ